MSRWYNQVRDQIGDIIMNNVKPGELKLERHRITLANYGSLLGKEIYSVGVKNMDPDYNKKKGTPDELVPSFPIKVYLLNRITVTGVKAEVDADGNTIIIFNDDSNLRFPIATPELRVPSVASIKDAIRAAENGEPPIFFEDCAKATAEITALNKANMNKAIKLSRDMAQQADGLQKAMDLDQLACERYLSELDSNVEISITVKE